MTTSNFAPTPSAEIVAALFKTEHVSDFEIHCTDQKFRVHRIILKNRSHYFRQMLNNEYAETSEGILKLEDVHPNVLKTLIDIIYTNKCDLTDLVENELKNPGILAEATLFPTASEHKIENMGALVCQSCNKGLAVVKACMAVSSLADRFLCEGVDDVLLDKITDTRYVDLTHFFKELGTEKEKEIILCKSLAQMFDNAGTGQSNRAQKLITGIITDRIHGLYQIGFRDAIHALSQHTDLMADVALEQVMGDLRLECPTCYTVDRFPRPKCVDILVTGKKTLKCSRCGVSRSILEKLGALLGA